MKVLGKNNRHFLFLACFAVVMAFIPLAITNAYEQYVLILCMVWAGVAVSWNLIAGYAGIFSLGHQAFFGFGAYMSAVISIRLHISPWISIFIGAAGAALIGVVISIPSLKLRKGPYISIATLAMAEMVRIVITNAVDLTRGQSGLWGIPAFPAVFGQRFDTASRVPSYYLALILLILALLVCMIIVRAPLGKSFKAIKDSQDAAESLGINVRFNKVLVFMIGAFITGMMGAFYAHTLQMITPNSVMSGSIGLQIISYSLVGGMGTIAGPVVGAFIIVWGLEIMKFLDDYRLITYAVMVILCVLYMPNGIYGSAANLFRHIRSRRVSAVKQ